MRKTHGTLHTSQCEGAARMVIWGEQEPHGPEVGRGLGRLCVGMWWGCFCQARASLQLKTRHPLWCCLRGIHKAENFFFFKAFKPASCSLPFLISDLSRNWDGCNSLPQGYLPGRKLKQFEEQVLLSLFIKCLHLEKREFCVYWGGGWCSCKSKERESRWPRLGGGQGWRALGYRGWHSWSSCGCMKQGWEWGRGVATCSWVGLEGYALELHALAKILGHLWSMAS